MESHFPNNDGVDVDSSRYVLVEGSTFRTGDDAVVIKSGRDLDGRTVGKPSEYVVVRRNDMGGEDGIALGSEMSGDIRYVFFTDNVLRSGSSGELLEEARRHFEVNRCSKEALLTYLREFAPAEP